MSAFRRTLPPRPNLEQQKKLAKDLIDAFRADDPEAIARIRAELPDKKSIGLTDAQYVLAREYGFSSWRESQTSTSSRSRPTSFRCVERFKKAVRQRDADALRRLPPDRDEAARKSSTNRSSISTRRRSLQAHDADVIDALLELGADPNRRSSWWAGGFHPLYGATPAAAERLLAAGAIPDACAAAHLDRLDLLSDNARRRSVARPRTRRRRTDAAALRAIARGRRSAARRRRRHRRARHRPSFDRGRVDVGRRRTIRRNRESRSPSISSSAAQRPTSFSRRRSATRHALARCSTRIRDCSSCARARASTEKGRRAAFTSICGRSARISRRCKRRHAFAGEKRWMRCGRTRPSSNDCCSRVTREIAMTRARSSSRILESSIDADGCRPARAHRRSVDGQRESGRADDGAWIRSRDAERERADRRNGASLRGVARLGRLRGGDSAVSARPRAHTHSRHHVQRHAAKLVRPRLAQLPRPEGRSCRGREVVVGGRCSRAREVRGVGRGGGRPSVAQCVDSLFSSLIMIRG